MIMLFERPPAGSAGLQELAQENAERNVAKSLRTLVNDGYLDNEEGFTLEDLSLAINGKEILGDYEEKLLDPHGETIPPEDSDEYDGRFLKVPRGVSGSPSAFAARLQPVFDRLVAEGILEVREDGRYVLGEEKWEELKFPKPEDQESE